MKHPREEPPLPPVARQHIEEDLPLPPAPPRQPVKEEPAAATRHSLLAELEKTRDACPAVAVPGTLARADVQAIIDLLTAKWAEEDAALSSKIAAETWQREAISSLEAAVRKTGSEALAAFTQKQQREWGI